MDNKFLYRSSLKSKEVQKFQVMGIVTEIVLSKEEFPKNSDIVPFLEQIFKVQFKEYVMRSRTLIVSRLMRLVDNSDEEAFKSYRVKLLKYVELSYDIDSNKTSSRTPASKWVTGG